MPCNVYYGQEAHDIRDNSIVDICPQNGLLGLGTMFVNSGIEIAGTNEDRNNWTAELCEKRHTEHGAL